MIKYALRRIALGIMIMLGSSVLIYALILAAPGGPEQKFAENPKYTQEQKEGYLKSLGLDKPEDPPSGGTRGECFTVYVALP